METERIVESVKSKAQQSIRGVLHKSSTLRAEESVNKVTSYLPQSMHIPQQSEFCNFFLLSHSFSVAIRPPDKSRGMPEFTHRDALFHLKSKMLRDSYRDEDSKRRRGGRQDRAGGTFVSSELRRARRVVGRKKDTWRRSGVLAEAGEQAHVFLSFVDGQTWRATQHMREVAGVLTPGDSLQLWKDAIACFKEGEGAQRQGEGERERVRRKRRRCHWNGNIDEREVASGGKKEERGRQRGREIWRSAEASRSTWLVPWPDIILVHFWPWSVEPWETVELRTSDSSSFFLSRVRFSSF